MAKLGVCMETFFTDMSYEDRIKRIHELGFTNYEFWFHNKRFDGSNLTNEDKDFERIAELNDLYGLTCTDFVFNHPDGGIAAGLIDKNDQNIILEGIERIIEKAKIINCSGLITTSGNRKSNLSGEEAVCNMTETLKIIAPVCEKSGITLLLELFNTKVDHPGYFLDDPNTCIDILKAVNSPNVKMLFDIYHVQIMSGNITGFIRKNIQYIGHFHIAGVPGRHEPDKCELNYAFIINELDRLDYKGYAGLEYWPAVDSSLSLTGTKYYLEGQTGEQD
ncbi:MAG: TIM barrel protein [Spirochaetes bacterium]|nr:TIM barrel protein [Spirochaetota bacterium]